MITSIAANHAKGKSAQDKIFGANAAAVAAAAKYGADKVTNATIGAILDEDEKLVCLPTIDKVYRGLAETVHTIWIMVLTEARPHRRLFLIPRKRRSETWIM